MLRRYYVSHGYADFTVRSAVAQLTPDGRDFYITFTVDEGQRYNFGPVAINSQIPELTEAALRPLLKFKTGDLYNAELLQKAIDGLTNAAGEKGYAFAEVHPDITPDRAKRTVNVAFNITQGPRVYIERIDITGNTRTADKVIRREFRLVEGDAFNQVLVDRSRTRIRALGFFSNVDGQPCRRQPAGPHQRHRRGHRAVHRLDPGRRRLFLPSSSPDRRHQLYRHQLVRLGPVRCRPSPAFPRSRSSCSSASPSPGSWTGRFPPASTCKRW